MKNNRVIIYTVIVFLTACNTEKEKETVAPQNTMAKKIQQVVIEEENLTPTVDIKNFTLISDDPDAYKADAKEIMKVKRNWPLAMQRKDSTLFEEILSDNFTFRASYEFFPDKKSYIKERVAATWTIDTVHYENLVLQFFGDIAVLTYKNRLIGTDSIGKPNIEYYVWADMYSKENSKWKIIASHEIDSRIEYTNKK